MTDINLYTLDDKNSFAPLSNDFFNYKNKLIINDASTLRKKKMKSTHSNIVDEKENIWRTVSNYIYSNMLSSDFNDPTSDNIYKDLVKKMRIPGNIYSIYMEGEKNNFIELFKIAIDKAISTKIEESNNFKEALLSTNAGTNIVYRSSNIYLGKDEDDKGFNLYGKCLTKHRNKILQEKTYEDMLKKEAEDIRILYKAFKTFNILYALTKKGNDLERYLDDRITFEQIIEENNDISFIPLEYFKNNYDKGIYPIVYDDMKDVFKYVEYSKNKNSPIPLIQYLRKKEIRKIYNNMLLKYKFGLFNSYILSLTSKESNDPKNQEKALLRYRKKLVKEGKLIETIDEIFKLYTENALGDFRYRKKENKDGIPVEAMDEEELRSMSEEEITEIENMEIIKEGKDQDIIKEDIDEEEKRERVPRRDLIEDRLRKRMKEQQEDKVARRKEEPFEPQFGPELPPEFSVIEPDLAKEILSYNPGDIKYNPADFEKVVKLLIDKKEKKEINVNCDGVNILCPTYNDNFIVDGYTFKNISQYIFVFLLSKINYNTFETAYKVLQNEDSEKYDLIYTIQDMKYYEDRITVLATNALEQKFKNKNLRELLLLTGDSKLIWGDKNDIVLGVGPNGKGANFVGKELMRIREGFKTMLLNGKRNIISPNDIDSLFNDEYLSEWLYSRIKDVSDVTVDIYKNINKKRVSEWRSLNPINIELGLNTELNIYTSFSDAPELLLSVLTDIYEPCSAIFSKYKYTDNDISLPAVFVENLKKIGIQGERNQMEMYLYIRSILSSIVVNSSNCTIDKLNVLIDIMQNINSAYNKDVKLNEKKHILWAKNENNYFLITLINLIIKISKITKTNPTREHIKSAIYIIFKNETQIDINDEDEDEEMRMYREFEDEIRLENENFDDEKFDDVPELQDNNLNQNDVVDKKEEDENEENIDFETFLKEEDENEEYSTPVISLNKANKTQQYHTFDDYLKANNIRKDDENIEEHFDTYTYLQMNKIEEEEEAYFDEDNEDILGIVEIFERNKVNVSKTFAYHVTQAMEKYVRYLHEPMYINRINFFHPVSPL